MRVTDLFAEGIGGKANHSWVSMMLDDKDNVINRIVSLVGKESTEIYVNIMHLKRTITFDCKWQTWILAGFCCFCFKCKLVFLGSHRKQDDDKQQWQELQTQRFPVARVMEIIICDQVKHDSFKASVDMGWDGFEGKLFGFASVVTRPLLFNQLINEWNQSKLIVLYNEITLCFCYHQSSIILNE